MIGLEYILSLNSITATELASELHIKKQNVSNWFVGNRKIPRKYLNTLKNKFKIPEEYITKNIRKSDKLIIQKYKIVSESILQDSIKDKLKQIDYDIKRYKILEKIEDLMFNENINYENTNFNLELCKDLLDENNQKIIISILKK